MIMKEIHFFTGKGGAGKSTNAVFYAFENSTETLLCSLDPAHNLKNILQLDNLREIKKWYSSLDIEEPGMESLKHRYLSDVESNLKSNSSYLSSFNLLDNFDIIKFSPGLEEYAVYYGFKYMMSKYDKSKRLFVFDMPPTALSLRFFSLPHISMAWLEKLIDLRYKIIEKKSMVSKVKKEKMPEDKVLRNLVKQKAGYADMINILSNATIHIVLNPEPVSISEGIDLLKALDDLGYNNIIIHLNKYQGEIPSELGKLIDKYTLVKVPEFEIQPIGISQISKSLKALY